MAKNIRTLVAIAAAPLFLAIGSAHAAKAVAPEPGNIAFEDKAAICAAELNATEDAIRAAYANGQFMGSGAYTNYLNLLSKLVGVDLKLEEDPPKLVDAYVLLSDVMDKATAWKEAPKAKLTVDAAQDIATKTYASMYCIGIPY